MDISASESTKSDSDKVIHGPFSCQVPATLQQSVKRHPALLRGLITLIFMNKINFFCYMFLLLDQLSFNCACLINSAGHKRSQTWTTYLLFWDKCTRVQNSISMFKKKWVKLKILVITFISKHTNTLGGSVHSLPKSNHEEKLSELPFNVYFKWIKGDIRLLDVQRWFHLVRSFIQWENISVLKFE